MLRKIERYEVLDELGHGGMATVYRARDSKLDRMIALKVMHPHLRGAKEARARFRREAQSVARLGHPRILEIYDYSGEDSEESYIASQLLTGPTLRKWSEDHAPVPAEIAACIGIEIAEALAAAHEKGIVHRDVKPENILLHENRELKLTDFGIADMVDSQSMTATGQILGSPGHMSPEQIEGGDTDVRTDIFALGTVLYFLSTGRLPFTGKNPHQILKRIVDGEYPDPLRLEPKIGGRMRSILKKTLEKKPEDRFETAKALSAELRAFVLELGIDDPGAEVARFLAAPAEQTKAIGARIVERYTEMGRAAQAKGNIPLAHDCFSRVLSYDEGNQDVLAQLARIGHIAPTGEENARRRRLAWTGVGLGGVVALVLAGRFFGGGDTTGEDGTTVPEVVLTDDARDAGSDAGGASDAPTVTDAPGDAPGDAGEGAPYVAIHRVTPTRLPRHVEFQLTPQNVLVSIDGGGAESYMRLFDGRDLSIGPHDIVITSTDDCCSPLSFVLNVEPGDGPMTVTRALSIRDASLIARGPSNLRVVVGGGRASGGPLDALFVTMTRRTENLSIEATAPGCLPQTTTHRFTAGETTTWTFVCEPVPEEPPPTPPTE